MTTITTGSIRQRGPKSWELRIYLGRDPMTRKERWATKTVTGTRRYAAGQLAEFREVASLGRLRAGSVAELLERWFVAASPGWAPTTCRETRSLINRHLVPHLGEEIVEKLVTAQIDAFYAKLLNEGGRDGRPLAPGTVHRTHVVLHRALAQAVRWDWIWTNPATHASPPRPLPSEIRPQAQNRSFISSTTWLRSIPPSISSCGWQQRRGLVAASYLPCDGGMSISTDERS